MSERSFNLLTEPWISVIESDTDETKLVSLKTLFKNAPKYRQLAGETQAQDLSILRLILAILHTVYSRFDGDGEPYDWLTLDEDTLTVTDVDEDDYEDDGVQDLLDAWQTSFQSGTFSPAVIQYLEVYRNKFDFFGTNPFYQVTAEEYDSAVPAAKAVAKGKGTVSIKQINRSISESGNSPSLFSPKTNETKELVELDSLVRWIIAYQNYTGVTDKTKIETPDKFSNGAGWTYRIDPVFIQGNSLFETLLLNLVLVSKRNETTYVNQHPVWEYVSVPAYIEYRKKLLQPDNVAELYTTWSRLLHLEWSDKHQPKIFSAGIPMFAPENFFTEPMTTWRWDSKAKPPVFKPTIRGKATMSQAMWRHFGRYINVYDSEESMQPGVIDWLQRLRYERKIEHNRYLSLRSVVVISDGNATSQAPAAEITDALNIQANVLFDDETLQNWPQRIEETIELTQQVAKDYWSFIQGISAIRNVDSKEFAVREQALLYQNFNQPFNDWLASLSGRDNRDERINEWKDVLRRQVIRRAEFLMQSATPRDITGIDDRNIFSLYNSLRRHLAQRLG